MTGSDVAGPGTAGSGRRYWKKDEKRRIVAESFAAGASVAEIARRHGLNANLLFTWRRRYAVAGAHPRVSAILPVTITPSPAQSIGVRSEPLGRMEIILPSGEKIVVGADVDASALARVVKALRR
jgi:transposase